MNTELLDAPVLQSSTPYIENFFKYRWDNIAALAFAPNGRVHKYPGVFEGSGYFKKHISYSAQVHMRELRWLKDPSLAQGSILNFIENQRDDGSFPGHLGEDSIDEESFYHADWGTSVLEVNKIHPDLDFLQKVYKPLCRYVDYFGRERNPTGKNLYAILNHYETGQEFSPRYSAVDPESDRDNWGHVFTLLGVDATAYIYNTQAALAKIASLLSKDSDSAEWSNEAYKTKRSVRSFMWDKGLGMFFDIDPQDERKTYVKSLTCFYPYMTDLVSWDHLQGFKKHLFNPREFWTPYPFPTVSIDNPQFSADGIWKNQKRNCPWNGRVWPMTNSHMAEAIAISAIRFNDNYLKIGFVDFFNRWMRMMCFDSNPKRPNSFEHYNPFTGTPSSKEFGFGDFDDYLHSWVNDQIIQYFTGIRAHDNGKLIIDPFPFGQSVNLSNLFFRGEPLKLSFSVNYKKKTPLLRSYPKRFYC